MNPGQVLRIARARSEDADLQLEEGIHDPADLVEALKESVDQLLLLVDSMKAEGPQELLADRVFEVYCANDHWSPGTVFDDGDTLLEVDGETVYLWSAYDIGRQSFTKTYLSNSENADLSHSSTIGILWGLVLREYPTAIPVPQGDGEWTIYLDGDHTSVALTAHGSTWNEAVAEAYLLCYGEAQ